MLLLDGWSIPIGMPRSRATGETHDPAMKADATITIALAKTGLEKARSNVGEL